MVYTDSSINDTDSSVFSSVSRDISYHLERLHYAGIIEVEENTDGSVTLIGHGKEEVYDAKFLNFTLCGTDESDFDNHLHLTEFIDAFTPSRRKKGVGNCGFRMVRAIERALQILEIDGIRVFGCRGRIELTMDNGFYLGSYHPESLLEQLLMDDGGYGMYNGLYIWKVIEPAKV